MNDLSSVELKIWLNLVKKAALKTLKKTFYFQGANTILFNLFIHKALTTLYNPNIILQMTLFKKYKKPLQLCYPFLILCLNEKRTNSYRFLVVASISTSRLNGDLLIMIKTLRLVVWRAFFLDKK